MKKYNYSIELMVSITVSDTECTLGTFKSKINNHLLYLREKHNIIGSLIFIIKSDFA